MSVFISVVSHGHDCVIKKLGSLLELSETFTVILKSNKPGDDFSHLNKKPNFHWIDEQYYNGFGCNNNINFNHALNVGLTDDDFFIVLNPDVCISTKTINEFTERISQDGIELATLNLFRDHDLSLYDNSIRHFPSLVDFIGSFLGLSNRTIIDKSLIDKPIEVDWAAGSLLAFRSYHYKRLKGFDERYFMYCEDVDICNRSQKFGVSVMYYNQFKAVHLAGHANRSLLSKHFLWHLISSLRFVLSKYIPAKIVSSI